MALSAGRDRVLMASEGSSREVANVVKSGLAIMAALPWPGLLRQLDRHSPGYDA